ncbi:hypothetical protein [Microbacterium sp. APC 3901]|uniref:hypothetical protein n=1 Tax=Microbacterium sp. APC 3901 TaxID=3035192 RepID=UPI0025B370CE|nr:hypothetical protein [Microbacterium sp. APC 3901]MDN3442786.1 hypothetical protein [Microbacterium sp. APC 3901]
MRLANPGSRIDPLVVLTDHRSPQANVSYIDQIIGEGVDGIKFSHFARELRDLDVDVVHVNQAVRLLGGAGTTNDERADIAQAVVAELRRRELPLVQTLYGPHQGAGAEWRRAFDDATAMFIVLDEATSTPAPGRTTVIPHAHYRDRFVGYPRKEQIPGRLLAISPNRLVKVAAGPLKIFPLTNTPGLSLRVMGQPNAALDALLEKVLGRHPERVSAVTGLVSDAMMVNEISASELVILPDNATLVDESMLMLALSLDRPVLVPESAATRLLAEEVGSGWVHHHEGAVTAERLDEVVDAVRNTPRSEHPDLSRRDAGATAARYAEVFRSVATSDVPA